MQDPIFLFKGKKYIFLLLSYIVISRGPPRVNKIIGVRWFVSFVDDYTRTT